MCWQVAGDATLQMAEHHYNSDLHDVARLLGVMGTPIGNLAGQGMPQPSGAVP